VCSPHPEASLPIEFKGELFAILSSAIARQLQKRGLKEDEIVAGLQLWRQNKLKLVAEAGVFLAAMMAGR